MIVPTTSIIEKFISILQSYNKSGVENILNGSYEQALVYLEEA